MSVLRDLLNPVVPHIKYGIALAHAKPREMARGAWATLVRSPTLLTMQNGGLRHPIEIRVPSSDVPTYRQVVLNGEYHFDAGSPPKTIIDGGANIGLASAWFASRYPDAQIVAVEPERGNFELLQKNVAPYPTVTPMHAALWSTVGTIDLCDPGQGSWGFRVGESSPESMAHPPQERAPALTIDAVMGQLGWDYVDLLKIDIEGAEREVFADVASWIDRVGMIVVELHDRFQPGCTETFEKATTAFTRRWRRGENIFVTR